MFERIKYLTKEVKEWFLFSRICMVIFVYYFTIYLLSPERDMEKVWDYDGDY